MCPGSREAGLRRGTGALTPTQVFRPSSRAVGAHEAVGPGTVVLPWVFYFKSVY